MSDPWQNPVSSTSAACNTCGAHMTAEQAIAAIKDRYPLARTVKKKVAVVYAKNHEELLDQAAYCECEELFANFDEALRNEPAKQQDLVRRGVISQRDADEQVAYLRKNIAEERVKALKNARAQITPMQAFYCPTDDKVHVVKGAEPKVLKHELLHAHAHEQWKATTKGYREFNEAMTERLQWGIKGGGPADTTTEYLAGPYKLAADRETLGGADAMERAYFLGDFGPMRSALARANPPTTLEKYMQNFRTAMYAPPPAPSKR